MESPIEERNEKAVFLSFYPHFFCYNDAPGAMGNLEPNMGEQRHHKQRTLQLHACGPLRLPRG